MTAASPPRSTFVLKVQIATALCAAAILAASAKADDIPPCNVPPSVKSMTLLSATPVAIQQAVRDTVGDIVPAGEPFDSTDVATVGRFRRLIFIWNTGRRWVVATEHGGIVYNDPIFAYVLNEDAALAETVVAAPNTVCVMATNLIKK